VRTDKLVRNDLSPGAMVWYREYLAALDAKDIEAYAAFLSDDCTLTFNNADPVSGKIAVVGMLRDYWASFGEIEHDLLTILGNDQHFALEALNHYTQDGRTITLRAVAITERDNAGGVRAVRLYSDTSPLFGGDRS